MPFPNPDTQFKPGVSGNPKGAPKGNKHIATWIQELTADDDLALKFTNGELKGVPIKAMVEAMIIKAAAGDVKAFDVLAKYGWGSKVSVSIDEGDEAMAALRELYRGTRSLSDDSEASDGEDGESPPASI